jgi:predicted amino acid dehydrogenase
LCADVDRAIANTGLAQPRILVIGPYGILGSAVCQHLQQQGRQILGFGGNESYLTEFAEKTGIDVAYDLRDAGAVDIVVACTHSDNARLTAEHIALLRKANQKLVVVDVAEPANLGRQVYHTVQHQVIRQDAGNAWSADLRYVLGSLTSKQLMLAQGTVFGCFAEALALYHTVYREHNPTALSRDWFEVNTFNQTLVAEAFHSLRIGLPKPHCFGKPVDAWTLWQNAQPLVGEQH